MTADDAADGSCERDECARVRDDLAALSRQHQDLHDRYMRMTTDRAADDRRRRSAGRRALERDRLAVADVYVHQAVRERGGHAIRYALDQLRDMPDRPRPTDVARIRTAAHAARITLDGAPPAVDVFAEAGAEVARIRAYVLTTGRALHATHGRADVGGPGVVCECVGCELIIGLDDLPDDVTGRDLA